MWDRLEDHLEEIVASGITEEQVKAILAEHRNEQAAQRALPPKVPPPAPPITEDPFAQRRAEAVEAARAAASASTEHTELVVGARSLLETKLGAKLEGDWNDDDLLVAAGLAAPKGRKARADWEREQRERTILADPVLLRQHDHEQELSDFRAHYWHVSRHQRTTEADRLGIDLSTYKPPTEFNGRG